LRAGDARGDRHHEDKKYRPQDETENPHMMPLFVSYINSSIFRAKK
jgi:hypothetical protein